MPAHCVAVDWVNDRARSEEELRRACTPACRIAALRRAGTIMELHDLAGTGFPVTK